MDAKETTTNLPPQIYDPVRELWVANSPEERVRQAVTHHLMHTLGYPKSRIGNEITIKVGQVTRRCDSVIYDARFKPIMVVEYKAPTVQLTDTVLTQVFNYNSVLLVPFVMISNGKSVAVYKVGYGGERTESLSAIPTYDELLSLLR